MASDFKQNIIDTEDFFCFLQFFLSFNNNNRTMQHTKTMWIICYLVALKSHRSVMVFHFVYNEMTLDTRQLFYSSSRAHCSWIRLLIIEKKKTRKKNVPYRQNTHTYTQFCTHLITLVKINV